MPLWPGEPAVTISRTASIGEQCPVNVGAISAPLHAGTHADAPYHYDPCGTFSAECALDPYLGPCVVLDVSRARGRVEIADVDWAAIAHAERVLFRTYGRFPADWDAEFLAIAPEVIARLREAQVKLVGTDAPSLDPQESETLDAHREIQAGDMRILEGLLLDAVLPGRYELIALPLKIAKADASPVRAILRELI
jgi:arylformamidase